MAHTPLANQIRNFVAAQRRINSGAVQGEAPLAARADSLTRRDFVQRAGVAMAAMAAAPLLNAAKGKPRAKVVIVGAGLAGLTCAYRLKQAGLDATIYEANTRLGGRCWTRRNDFLDGQTAEHGGELIDQGHKNVRHLAQELRLPLDNLLAAEANGTEAFFHFNGEKYSYRDATRDLKAIWQKIHRDLSEAGFPTLYHQSTARGRQLDQMSITDWINETVPGGTQSQMGRLLTVAYTIEYGAECEQQSALSLLYLLGYNSPGQFSIFGASNEKYRVRGGNDQIVSALATPLGAQIYTGMPLVAVRRTSAGTYALTFENGGSIFEVPADKVVLALPFSILRTAVDLTGAGFSARKMTAIEELGMGSNSKLNVQFSKRAWIPLGNNGDTFSDRGYQATWEASRDQSGASGILVGYSGGDYADTFGQGTPASRAAQFLGQIQPVLPGLSAHFNGRATIDFWKGNVHTRGSYAYWKVGQYTQFAGVEGEQEGNAHFCGEHTSIESQGYLNGAVETGERVAEEITADLGI